MNLSITTLAYLFLQLSPFIIISYFSLSSVFNRDVKGIVFLFGLLFNLFGFFMVSSAVKAVSGEGIPFLVSFKPVECASFDTGFSSMFNQSTNTSVLSFTFWYIMFTLIELDMKEIGVKHGMEPDKANKLWQQNFPTPFINENWPSITILILLLVGNIYINTKEFTPTGCFNLQQQIFPLAVSGCLGIAWAALIRSTKSPELQYFTKYKNNENCKKASTKQFRCEIYKNGVKVGSTSDDNIFTING